MSRIIIKKSSDAPDDVKRNPFYNQFFWGRANDFDDVFVPDSDEVLSFALAGHEIGHLSKVDRGDLEDVNLDNFEATKNEETRAWRVGKKYLKKHINQYYPNDPAVLTCVLARIDRVESIMMKMVDWSQDMYGKDCLTNDNQPQILAKRRVELFNSKKDDWDEFIKKLHSQEVGRQVEWKRFVKIVKLSLRDIIKDNRSL